MFEVKSALGGMLALSAVVLAGPVNAQIVSPEPPLPRLGREAAAEAVSARAGTFKFVITLVRKPGSIIPPSHIPVCFASVSHWPATYQLEQGSVISEAGKCIIMLPYNWPKADNGVHISPRIWMMTNKDNYPTSTAAGARYIVQDLGAQALPANGATTTFNATLHY